MEDFWQGNIGFRDSKGGELINTLQAKRSIRATRVTIGVTATSLPSLVFRRSALIQNISANIVYMGGSGVTTAGATQGFHLRPRAVLRIDAADDVGIYGIAAVASNIIVLEGA